MSETSYTGEYSAVINGRKYKYKIEEKQMSEIEKLYELAGVEKEWKPLPYGDIEEYYPPFTAEKQLELIELLGSVRDYTVEIDKFKGVYFIGCREAGSNNKHWGSHNLFEEAIAELVNDLWQDLTETEKEEIKRILENE